MRGMPKRALEIMYKLWSVETIARLPTRIHRSRMWEARGTTQKNQSFHHPNENAYSPKCSRFCVQLSSMARARTSQNRYNRGIIYMRKAVPSICNASTSILCWTASGKPKKHHPGSMLVLSSCTHMYRQYPEKQNQSTTSRILSLNRCTSSSLSHSIFSSSRTRCFHPPSSSAPPVVALLLSRCPVRSSEIRA